MPQNVALRKVRVALVQVGPTKFQKFSELRNVKASGHTAIYFFSFEGLRSKTELWCTPKRSYGKGALKKGVSSTPEEM